MSIEMNVYQGEEKTVIPNKYVACVPFKTEEDKGSAFSSWQLKNPLVGLRVVFADKEGDYAVGSTVFLRPFLDPPGFIKEVFTLKGQEIILVPKDCIVGCSFIEAPKFVPMSTLPQWHDYPQGTGTLPSITFVYNGSDLVKK